MPSLQHSIDTLQKLVGHPSVSSTSNTAVSEMTSEALADLGFDVEKTTYLDPQGVTKMNLVARRQPAANGSTDEGGLAYFCHTDVVPADDWTGPGGDPFQSVVQGNRIYGRGSCDTVSYTHLTLPTSDLV